MLFGLDMKTVMMTVAIVAILALLSACFPSTFRRNTVLPAAVSFGEAFAADSSMLMEHTQRLSRIIDEMESGGLYVKGRQVDFNIAEKERFYDLWSAYIDNMHVLEQISRRYADFGKLDKRADRHRAFSLAFAALMARQYGGYRLVTLTIGNDLYEKKLDDANEERGIPYGLYALLKWNTIHVEKVTLLSTGRYYLKRVKRDLQKTGLAGDPTVRLLHEGIEEHYRYVKSSLKSEGAGFFGSNGLDILADGLGSAWFPVQKGVASFMGDVRFREKGKYLITIEQIHRMEQELEPGDIIVERRNWYLSNVGLPGFWPHAELYVGDLQKLAAYFDEQEVNEHFRNLGPYKGFVDYLEKEYPKKTSMYGTPAPDGNPRRVIEAIGEGVSMSSLESATQADYIGVMRPRLRKIDKALAIEQAFRYVGRDYDFDFDFLTDSTIVCSELIYKAYMPDKDKLGLGFRLDSILARKVLPPNSIVRKFADEYNDPDRELDFVYFLEGNESDGKAYVRGLPELMVSHARPKWDIAQR